MESQPKQGPLVTVLISTFNRPRYFAEALRSIVRQRYRNLQVIAVNDGGASVSDAVKALGDDRVTLIDRKENRGLAHSFNEALQYARGKYVAYLGDDDLFYPQHVQKLVDALEGPTDCQVAYSDLYKVHCRIEDDGSRTILGKVVKISRDFDRHFMLHFNHTLHVCMMHRLDLLDKTGLYNENVRVLIDWDMTRRFVFHTDFLHLRDITGEFYAPSGTNDRISYRMRKDHGDYLKNMLTIRTTRPPMPWPKVHDLSMIFLPDSLDEAAHKQLRDMWMWTYAPHKLYLPQSAMQLSRLRTQMPNIVPVPVDSSASAAQRVDAALKHCTAPYVAIVPGGLPIANSYVENPLFALWDNTVPRTAFTMDHGHDRCWGVVVRTAELLEARRRYPSLDVRRSLESCNFDIRCPEPKERPFKFDALLAEAESLQNDGEWLSAAMIYEKMQTAIPNAQWMKEEMAAALYKSGRADFKALQLAQEINLQQPTVDTLLLEARLLKRADRAQEAADRLERAREILNLDVAAMADE